MAVKTFVHDARKKTFYDTGNFCYFAARDIKIHLFTGFCLSHLQNNESIYNASINFILEPNNLKDYVLHKQSWAMHL